MKDDTKILRQLKSIIGKPNFWTGEILHDNSTYNDLIWNYWHYFDGFPESGFLKPNELSSVGPIDRAIRQLEGRLKNITLEKRYRDFYSKTQV